ncbi:DHH family phosphoesterase [Methylomonas sp. AM2-LC]|uniref:DHHA1 domain-containing protein n=1 Tax=Methylomonas sp. AM2-LC TaxID=3153301 RepID=UPI0032650188
MNKNILVIYHANCLDGFGAAYAAWRKFGDTADYLPATYGSQPPDVAGKDIYILDFSYFRDILIDMHSSARSLIVIDHHKTAQSNLVGLDFAIFDMTHSGCMLAWQYFHPSDRISSCPFFLYLIEDRDLWKFHMPSTKPFNAGLRAFVPFEFDEWRKLEFDGAYTHVITERGKDVELVHAKDVADFAQHQHPCTLNGISGLACNVPPKFSSDLGNTLANQSGTYGLTYSYSGIEQKWWCQLRSNGNFDVSEIAKHFGGGGHKNAAGFSSRNLVI